MAARIAIFYLPPSTTVNRTTLRPIHQIDPDIRHAVFGNVGSMISFRVGAEDAPFLAAEFQPDISAEDLLNLPNHQIYLRLMIDGSPCRPFSANTISFGSPH